MVVMMMFECKMQDSKVQQRSTQEQMAQGIR